MTTETLTVNPEVLREEVKKKYRDVACNPHGEHHFHTGRPLAHRLGYDQAVVGAMPDAAVESFAGVANPFVLRSLARGERVVDAGSGAGFDSFIAAHQVGPTGKVIGVDMTPDMVSLARSNARKVNATNVEFRLGEIEHLPVADGSVDVILSTANDVGAELIVVGTHGRTGLKHIALGSVAERVVRTAVRPVLTVRSPR